MLKKTFRFGLISLLLVVLLLLSSASPHDRQSVVWTSSSTHAQNAGSNTLFLPLMGTAPAPPAFEITGPRAGWTVSGMLYFSAHPTDPTTVSSITFRAGSTILGTDSTSSDGYRVFLDADAFPAGPLQLTAIARGRNGETTKTVTVTNLPNPPSSGTVSEAGGVFASEIGSLVTIPPGGLPVGSTVTVDEKTQAEITAENGIDWDAMGVTFLGHQSVQTNVPVEQPITVASAGFGNRVQPGQVVVNYRILPDVDGDGVDELVVVNTASVAPNNDVISDPVPQTQIVDVNVDSRSVWPLRNLPGDPISGPTGTLIEVTVEGFNPYAVMGNIARFESGVDNTVIEVPGVMDREYDGSQYRDVFAVLIPYLPPGPATLTLHNESTLSEVGPIEIIVETPVAITRPAAEIIDEYFVRYIALLEEFRAVLDEPPPSLEAMIAEMTEMRTAMQELSTDPSPEIQQFLVETATTIENSGLLDDLRVEDADGAFLAACVDKTKLKIGKTAAQVLAAVAAFACATAITNPVSAGVCALGVAIIYIVFDVWWLGDLEPCDEPPEPQPNPPVPPPGNGGGNVGMGSAPPPGGYGWGNGQGPSQSLATTSVAPLGETGRVMVKIYSNGVPTVFTGMADAGGYFYIPLIPAGEEFIAIATDTATGETRTLGGIGPQTGEGVALFFNFFSEEGEVDTVYWDGGGDGTSWHDPFNWNPNTIPGTTQDVVIDVAGDLTVNHTSASGNNTIRSLQSEERLALSGGTLSIAEGSELSNTLTFTGGTLAGVGTVTVSGNLIWSGGTMTGTGTTRTEGGLTLNTTATKWLDGGRTLTNAATATWSSGQLLGRGNSVFNNLAGATFDIQGDLTFNSNVGGLTFNNLGTIRKSSGSGIAYFYPPLTNSGTVNVQSGTFTLYGNGTSSGALQSAPTATLQFGAGTHTLTVSSNVTNTNVQVSGGTVDVSGTYAAGATTLSGGTLTFNVPVTSTTFNQSGGTLGGAGNLTVSGMLTWSGGTMTGSGTTRANGGLTLNTTGTKWLDGGRTLTNIATATWSSGQLLGRGNSFFNNLAGATFDIQGDLTFNSNVGGLTFNNQGTLRKSGGLGIAYFYPTLTNGGTMNVQTGTFALYGNSTNSGTLQGAPVATLQFTAGTHTLTASSTVTNTNVQMNGGAVDVNGTYATLQTTLTGGTLTFNVPVTSTTFSQSGGTLAGTGNLTVSGMLTWGGGTMTGAGTTRANGGLTLNTTGTKWLDGGRTLTNVATATWSSGQLLGRGNSFFNNLVGATFDIQGDLTFNSNVGGLTFNNQGTLRKSSGSGIAYFYPTLTNSGTMNVQTGTLALYGNSSSSGVLQSAPTATLQFSAGTHTLTALSNVTNTDVQVSGGTVDISGTYAASATTLSGGTLTFNVPVTSATFSQSGGTLDGTGNLTVSGMLTWGGGTMTGSGTTRANGGLTLNTTGTKWLDGGRTLINAATAVWSSGQLLGRGNSFFNNLAGATFDIQGDLIFNSNTGGLTFNNQGTLRKSSGSGIAYLYPSLTNGGTISVTSGSLQFNGGFTQSASGILNVEIGGLTPITDYDQFIVTGQANLNGTLNVTLVGGFVPDPGDNFIVMTFGSRVGQFATVNGNGQAYTVNHNPTNVTLIAQ